MAIVRVWVSLLVASWSLYMVVALIMYPFTDSAVGAVKNTQISELLLTIARIDLDDEERLKAKREAIKHDMKNHGGDPSATLSDGIREKHGVSDVRFEEIPISEAVGPRGAYPVQKFENDKIGVLSARLAFNYNGTNVDLVFLLRKDKYGPLIRKNKIASADHADLIIDNQKNIILDETSFVELLFELSTNTPTLPVLDKINAALAARHPLPKDSVKAPEEKRLLDVSNGFEEIAEGCGDQVDHSDECLDVSVASRSGTGGFEDAVEGFHASVAMG